MSDGIELLIPSRERDLGGFSVHRVLPFAKRRMVGPFIFLDHMGPAEFPPGRGIEVRPHPHINLATVTYLFEGVIRHRDSLGSDQLIEPGAINWMTAGRGIVHSERAPEETLDRPSRLNGIQCWVALPEEAEETEPTFAHHPSKTLPSFKMGEAELRLLLGSMFGRTSPVAVHSDMFYLDAKVPAGARVDVPLKGREGAVYVADGEIRVGDETVEALSMAVGHRDGHLPIEAVRDSRLMILGGKPVGERFIFWNFVSSSKDRIEEAKAQWANGPGSVRFPKIPGDDREFVPSPRPRPRSKKGVPATFWRCFAAPKGSRYPFLSLFAGRNPSLRQNHHRRNPSGFRLRWRAFGGSMKKTILLAALIALAPSAFASHDEDQAETNEIRYCSAELIYADGTYRDFVRVDCESEFAGQCVKEVLRQNDEPTYVATDMKECDAARAKE